MVKEHQSFTIKLFFLMCYTASIAVGFSVVCLIVPVGTEKPILSSATCEPRKSQLVCISSMSYRVICSSYMKGEEKGNHRPWLTEKSGD